MLDHAKDFEKLKSILLIFPCYHRDEVRDHFFSASSHFHVNFCLHLLLILLFLALYLYTSSGKGRCYLGFVER